MAYGDSIGLGNITENWLFEFGFYNGDAQGNGDGGFSAVTQADGSANELKVAITSTSATSIDVDDTSVFAVNDHIKVDNEILKVTSITDSDTLVVERGAMNTTKATHLINTQIFWNNFFPLSLADVINDDVYYNGVILNKPTIRESINLSKSTAKTGNVNISIPDFDYEGSPVSKELFGGTRQYINHEVKIFCKINQDDLHTLGSYRLIDIATDGETIKLSLTAHRPWDFITIPQDKTSYRNLYVPVVYGDYTPNSSRQASQDYITSKKLFPSVMYGRGGKASGFIHRALDGNSGNEGRPHMYEPSLDGFAPLTDTASGSFDDTSQVFAGASVISSTTELFRGFKLKPISVHSTNNWGTDPSNAFDSQTANDTSTFAEEVRRINADGTASVTTTDSLILSVPEIGGTITELTIKIYYRLVLSGASGSFSASLVNKTLGRSDTIATRSSNGTTGPANSSEFDMTSSIVNGQMPETVQIDLVTTRVTGLAQIDSEGRVYDVRLFVKTSNAFGDDPQGAKNTAQETRLYCGGNGLLDNGWNSVSSIVYIHQAHRDLLSRFANLPDADPTGWSDLNSAKDWQIRYWIHEPEDLEKVLEKLQYEGGFIYLPTSNKYIFIKDSYGTTPTSNVLSKSDISKIQIKMTSFSELITKMSINYEKHPTDSGYVTTQTSSNSASRVSFNIKSAENINNVNLDAYVLPTVPATPSSNPNDDFYTYYDNIFGSLKLIVSCDIVNPAFYSLEVGDVIEFDENNMYPPSPMGHNSGTWNNLKMMIISLNRTIGRMSITAREVA